MKPKSTLRNFLILAGSSLLAVAFANAQNTNGTWLGNGSAWNDAGAWSGGTIADGTGFTANFTGVDITGNVSMSLGANRTIGNIIFTDATTSSNNLSLTGNTLTLDVASGAPSIDVTQSDRTLTIGSIIAGNDGLTKIGSGSLILSGANTFTGATTISTGTIELQGSAVTSFRSSTSIASGATLKVTGNGTANTAGVFNGLALGRNATGSVSITGAGTLVINGTVGFGNNAGAAATSVAMASGGLIDIQSGSLTNGGFQKAAWGSNLADMNIASGAVFDIWDGNAVTIDALTGAGTIRNGSNTAADKTLTIGADNGSGSFSGDIGGGLGTGNGRNRIAVTKSGSGTQILSGANTYTAITTVNAGTLQFAKTTALTSSLASRMNVKSGATLALNVGGTGEFTTANVTTLLTNLAASSSATNGMNAGSNLGFDTTNASGGSFTIGDVIANTTGSSSAGARGLTKLGTGTLSLTNTNTYTGATAVNAGTLSVSGSGSINNTSAINVAAGATFHYNSSTALTVAPSLAGNGTSNRAVIGGTGPINVAITLNNLGDVLSPGNSPGIQNYDVGQTWSSFSYDWEVNDFSDVTGLSAGSDFDQLGINGALDLSGGSGSYILNVLGLTAGNAAGLVPNFSEINRSWTILTTTTGITNFNAANWSINTTGFSDPDTGTWALAQSGNNLVLSYTAVPEPRAALLGGIGLVMLLRRRRR